MTRNRAGGGSLFVAGWGKGGSSKDVNYIYCLDFVIFSIVASALWKIHSFAGMEFLLGNCRQLFKAKIKNAANGQQSALSYVYDIGSKTVNRVKNSQ